MAQAPDSSGALSCFPPPTHEPSNEARVCSLAAPGVLDLDPYPPPCHRPPPPPNSFRDFRNPPRPLREASRLRAASPRPGPSHRRARGWTEKAGVGRSLAELVEALCPNCDSIPTPTPKSSANRAFKRGWWRIRTAPCGLSQTRGAKPREGVERMSGGPPVRGWG